MQGKSFVKRVVTLNEVKRLTTKGDEFPSDKLRTCFSRRLPQKDKQVIVWRWGGHSNPRTREGQRFSRPPDSTALAPHHIIRKV